MLGLALSLALSLAHADAGVDARVIRERIARAPSDCGLLFAPVDALGTRSLNNSAPLREAVIDELIEKAHGTCLRHLAQNLAFTPPGDPLTPRQRQRLLDHIELTKPAALRVQEHQCVQSDTSLEAILQLAQQAKRINSCRALGPNDLVVINESRGPAGLSIQYALQQGAQRNWNALLSLDVKGANGVSAQEMHRRIRSCVGIANPYLKGPSGESLELTILTPAEAGRLPANKRPPTVQIDIQPEGARSHSKAYAADIECSTILHEVLHLLGLCDEYDGKADGYECRTVNPKPSIMKSHSQVFADVVPRAMRCECVTDECHAALRAGNPERLRAMSLAWELEPADYYFRNKYCQTPRMIASVPLRGTTINSAQLRNERGLTITTHDISRGNGDRLVPLVIQCECPADDEACMRLRHEIVERLPSNGPSRCPIGSREAAALYGSRQDMTLGETDFTIANRPKGGSLLLPMHFQRIIGGACPDVTTQYNECAKWAYRGSWDKSNCAGVPPYCQDLWR